jgi:DNA (cytosine-5)-methyltransferase 1
MKSISLFSGAGGLDLGLEAADISTAMFVEADKDCRETLALNHPDVPVWPDVFSLKAADVRALVGSIDVIAGGPPCQSFSNAGLRDGAGQLFLAEYVRLVRELSPEFFVLENVTGLLTSKLRPVFDSLVWELRLRGYKVNHWKLNALDYGSPQKRVRVIVIGSLDSAPLRPTAAWPISPTLRPVIADLENDPGECAQFPRAIRDVMPYVPPGGNWRALPASMQARVLGNAKRASGGLTGYARRLSYDLPSPTLLAGGPAQRMSLLGHPRANRPLSVAEYRRIQGFPDTYKFAGSRASQYRQAGNAVPLSLAEAIGGSIGR